MVYVFFNSKINELFTLQDVTKNKTRYCDKNEEWVSKKRTEYKNMSYVEMMAGDENIIYIGLL